MGERATNIGAWLFQKRGVVPVPLILLAVAAAREPGPWSIAGGLIVVASEGLRLWGVAHIGPQSRTRGDDVRGLVDSGPFARCRNPLYVANLGLLAGVAVMSGRWWMPLAMVIPMMLHYSFVVRWEEANIARALGEPYLRWKAQVPRWGVPLPALGLAAGPSGDWPAAVRSERSTLIAILVIALAVVLRGALLG